MISGSHLVKCKSHDQNTKNSVHVVLGWAVSDVLGPHPMNDHTNAALRDIEHKKYNSETLSEVQCQVMDASNVIESHLVYIIEMFHS